MVYFPHHNRVAPRFGGSLRDLEALGQVDTERPADFYAGDRFVSRTANAAKPEAGILDEKITQQALDPKQKDNLLLYGPAGSGKSVLMRRVEEKLRQADIPVFRASGFMDEAQSKALEAFLKQHRNEKRVVLMADEVGLEVALDPQEFVDLKAKNPNLVIIGEAQADFVTNEDLSSDLGRVFPDSPKSRFFLPAPSKPEVLNMLQQVLDYCGFTGGEHLQPADLTGQPDLRHSIRALVKEISNWRSPDQPDDRHQPEAIPLEVYQAGLKGE